MKISIDISEEEILKDVLSGKSIEDIKREARKALKSKIVQNFFPKVIKSVESRLCSVSDQLHEEVMEEIENKLKKTLAYRDIAKRLCANEHFADLTADFVWEAIHDKMESGDVSLSVLFKKNR